MPCSSRSRRLVVWVLFLATMPALAAGTSDPQEVINQALTRAVAIPAQAESLCELAWPSDGPGDPLVAAMARQFLVGFGTYGLNALREAMFRVRPEHQADVTATLIDARRSESAGTTPDYLPALEEAIWYGSIEARRLAMAEISKFVFPVAILSTIDAIHENPELMLDGIRTLGQMRNERGRFFLGRTLNHAAPRYKEAAAAALVLLGDSGFQILRNALLSPTGEVREAALVALLPYAATNDLTSLYVYLEAHATTDDVELIERVRERTAELETVLEERQLAEAASADPEEVDPEP